MNNTKQLTVAAVFCLAMTSFAAIPAIATEPVAAPAEAAATHRLAIAGMT